MQYQGSFTETYAFENQLQSAWYPSPASIEHQHDYTEADLDSFFDQNISAENLPLDSHLPLIGSGPSATNTYRHITPVIWNEVNVDPTPILEQQRLIQSSYPIWLSPFQQETSMVMADQDSSIWAVRQQDHNAAAPPHLHCGIAATTPPVVGTTDETTYQYQPALDYTSVAVHMDLMRVSDIPQPVTPSKNASDIENVLTDLESDDPCYAKLLYRALKVAPDHTMDLKTLYNWIENNSNKSKGEKNDGWRNSVRHNLSMNGAFKRVGNKPYSRESGKTSWSLTSEAVKHGIISTTRFRKTPKQNKERRGTPAIKRQQSGAKGGRATKKAALARQAREKMLQQQQALEQQRHYPQHMEHRPPIQQSYTTEHYHNTHGTFYPSTPQQQFTTNSPYFSLATPVSQQQVSPYVPMPDHASQLPHPYAFTAVQPSQSTQAMSHRTLQDPLLYSTCPQLNQSDDYDFADCHDFGPLFVPDSGFSDTGAAHSDGVLNFLD